MPWPSIPSFRWPLMFVSTHEQIMREERAEMERMWIQRLHAEADLTERLTDRSREPWE